MNKRKKSFKIKWIWICKPKTGANILLSFLFYSYLFVLLKFIFFLFSVYLVFLGIIYVIEIRKFWSFSARVPSWIVVNSGGSTEIWSRSQWSSICSTKFWHEKIVSWWVYFFILVVKMYLNQLYIINFLRVNILIKTLKTLNLFYLCKVYLVFYHIVSRFNYELFAFVTVNLFLLIIFYFVLNLNSLILFKNLFSS